MSDVYDKELEKQEEAIAPREADEEEQGELDSLAEKGEDKDGQAKEPSEGEEKKADYGESDNAGEAEPSLYKPSRSRFGTGSPRAAQRVRRTLFIGGPLGIVAIIAVLLMIFVGQLKAVHFATVLRSGGFATFELSMRRFFADVEFDKTVTTADSTGPLGNRPDSKLLRRLVTGDDPRSVAQKLGREGSLQYVNENGEIKGFQFGSGNSDIINYDEIAQRLFTKNADQLTIRQRMTLRKNVVDEVNVRMAQRLGEEGRFFRNDFWTQFRDITGIRMSIPRQFMRSLLGEKPIEAETSVRLNQEENIDGSAGVDSGIDTVKKTTDAVKAETTNSIKLGQRLRDPTIYRTALSNAGINPDVLTETVAKASPYVLVGTLYCIGHDLGGVDQRINQSLEKQAARSASDIQVTSEQIMDGKNVNAAFVSAANADYDGVKAADGSTLIPPGEVSPYYKAATGQSMSGADMDSLKDTPSTHIETPLGYLADVDTIIKNAISAGAVNIPGIGKIINSGYDAAIDSACGTITNPAAQTAFVLFDVAAAAASGGTTAAATAMFKAAVFFGGGAYAGQALQSYVESLSGTGFGGGKSGVDKVNAGGVSTDYLNEQSNRGVAMGRPLSNDEAAATKTAALIETHKQFQDQAWRDRYFAINNPYSLVGSLSAYFPSSLASLGNRLADSLSSLPKTLASFVGGQLSGGLVLNLFNGSHQQVAYAADSVDFQTKANFFGVQQWGWSQEEINQIESNPDFDFANNAAYVEARPDLDGRFSKCYSSNSLLTDIPSGCDAGTLSQPDALHWRLYKVHSFVVDNLNQDVTKDNGN